MYSDFEKVAYIFVAYFQTITVITFNMVGERK